MASVPNAFAGVIDTGELRSLLEEIVRVTKSVSPFILNHHLDAAVDLVLNFILDLFDPQRTGCLRLLSAKVALGLLTSGRLAQKYRYHIPNAYKAHLFQVDEELGIEKNL